MPSLLDRALSAVAPSLFGPVQDTVPSVTMTVENKRYSGWKSLSVTKSMSSLTASYNFEFVDTWKPKGQKWPLVPGKEVLIKADERPFLLGFIDDLDVSFDETRRTLTINGRDKLQDLVDCSVQGPNFTFKNTGLLQLAKSLLEPFDLSVSVELKSDKIALLKPFEKFQIEVGETVFDALSRAAELRGFLIYGDGKNKLILANRGNAPGVDYHAGVLKEGENILSARMGISFANRFSDYTVKGQDRVSDFLSADESIASEGKSKDTIIKRNRPKILLAQGPVDDTIAQSNAEWEADNRAESSASATVTVQGWSDDLGSFWELNKLVYLDAPSIGIVQKMLVTNLNFSISSKGARTEIGLSRPDAFKLKKVVSSADDPIRDIGPRKSDDFKSRLLPDVSFGGGSPF